MLEKYQSDVEGYAKQWDEFVAQRMNKAFFDEQLPTAAAWKVKDLEDLQSQVQELQSLCDQIHFGFVDERWLVTMHLHEVTLPLGIQVIKLMQRRPQSHDPAGLDHLDFFNAQNKDLETTLGAEANMEWTYENSNTHCSWYSVWFNQTEAKLRQDTVLDPCIAELQEVRKNVLKS